MEKFEWKLCLALTLFKYDFFRGFVVYGAKDNEFRTARTYPKMVLIDVSVHDENHIAIDAPTMRTLYVKIPSREENSVVHIK